MEEIIAFLLGAAVTAIVILLNVAILFHIRDKEDKKYKDCDKCDKINNK